ncbi:hypothetical protein GCM10023320_39900 [Pseudonocardia adelaidensis]|uniref:Uncharacterized protein n=1 Tax=Pseudonocardia adelaidensis TaxID=648754 RepID=A0ABP9NL46_9PSEU
MSPTKHRAVNRRSIQDPVGVLLHTGGRDPLLREPGLVHDEHRTRLAELLDDPTAQVVARPVDIPIGPLSSCCIPSGVVSPATSANGRPFLPANGASNPDTNDRARRRGSTRKNRAAARANNLSNRPTCAARSSFSPQGRETGRS